MDICFEKTKIARMLLSYLSEHPNAQDSVDGISRQWVTEKTGVVSRTTMKEVLDDLVTQGLLEKNTTADGSILYHRRNRSSTAN